MVYSCVLYFHMANLNNLFNSEDSLVFAVAFLMSTKYIYLSKNGKAPIETVNLVLLTKYNDFTKDIIIWLTTLMIAEKISQEYMFKAFIYFLSILASTCKMDLPRSSDSRKPGRHGL